MAAFISPINKSIVTAHIDNNSTSSTSIGLKISGKGFFNSSNSSNNYDFNGIGFQLLSNASNFKELALIDTSNHFINSNYSSLRIAITEQLIAIKAQTSNNNYKSLLINSNLIITSNAVGIGIGTATPVSALQIQGDLTLSGVIRKTDGSLLSSSLWSNATTSSNIYYNQGFVGIGTTTPQSALHVQGDVTIAGLLRKTDGTIFAESQWSNSFVNNQTSIYYNQGFIGIGTTVPQSLLHLHTTSDAINLGIRMTNSNTSASTNDGFLIGLQSNQDGIIWNYENASIIFGTSNQERMKITNNGRVGIGTTNPQGLLDIRGDLILSGLIRKPEGTIFNESQWSNATNNLWASSNIYYNQGFVGIGTTAPQSALHVQGDVTIAGLLRKTDGTIFAESQWSNSFINNQTSIYYNQGFIGIGTTVPQSLLHLHTTSDVINLGIRMTNSNTSTSTNDGFIIGLQSNQDGIIWNYENASIIFGTSNQERMKITNNGRIGIGTTNPQGLLDIRGDLILGGRILNIDGTNYNLSQWSNATTSSNIYYNQGFVGIGTTAPQSLLHISGSNPLIRFTDNITGSSLNSGFIVGLDSNQNGLIWSYGNSQSLLLGTSNQERLRITSGGRVGIGTTNPQATLDINGNVNISGILTINNFQITSNPTIKFNSNTFFYDNQSQLNISNFSRIVNYPNQNSNTIKITSEFINVSNLIISGNIYKSSNIYNSNILETIWLRSTFNNNNIYYNQGLVGIANTNPQYTLDIIGDVNITGKYKVNGADLTISSTTFSDERIKTNINDINDDSALQQILSIQPKTYNYIETKERGTDVVYGFIAQQIKEVIPEAVKLQTEFIPNIYKPYPYINNQIFTYDDLTSNLSKNDVIKIKGIDYNYLYATIIDITSNLIVIDKEITGNECFIYGKEVKDFHTLDKSYIYTLNVCAIQDLYKMIIDLQTRVNNQELEIQQLLSIVSPPPPVIPIIPILEITSNITSNY